MNPEIALFWKDAYMKEFDATVLSASGEGEKSGKIIVLDKTAFYPEGGGQPSDFGTLKKENGEEFKVLFSGKNNGSIFHEIDKTGLNPGDKIHGTIDWNRRYKLMKMHTAMHLFCNIFTQSEQVQFTGNQLGPEESRLDVALKDFSKEKVQVFIDKANSYIDQKLPVTSYFVSIEDAKKDPTLFRLAEGFYQDMKELRIVEIHGVDKEADGGTHVNSLAEVGKVVLVKIDNKGKDRKRVYFRLE